MHPHYCELLAHLINPRWTLRPLCWPDTVQPSLPLQVFLQASNHSYRSSSQRGVLLCFLYDNLGIIIIASASTASSHCLCLVCVALWTLSSAGLLYLHVETQISVILVSGAFIVLDTG